MWAGSFMNSSVSPVSSARAGAAGRRRQQPDQRQHQQPSCRNLRAKPPLQIRGHDASRDSSRTCAIEETGASSGTSRRKLRAFRRSLRRLLRRHDLVDLVEPADRTGGHRGQRVDLALGVLREREDVGQLPRPCWRRSRAPWSTCRRRPWWPMNSWPSRRGERLAPVAEDVLAVPRRRGCRGRRSRRSPRCPGSRRAAPCSSCTRGSASTMPGGVAVGPGARSASSKSKQWVASISRQPWLPPFSMMLTSS